MRVLFISKNLIGDGLYISPALQAWWATHQDWEIDLLTLDEPTKVLYGRMGVPLRVTVDADLERADHQEGYDLVFRFDVGHAFTIGGTDKCHIAEAYAKMLGVTITSKKPTYIPYEGDASDSIPEDLVLLSMFSRSCASQQGLPPNKMLLWKTWEPLLRYLRLIGPIGVLGARTDRAPLPIAENEYFCGLPLNTVALMLRSAKLFVTIDNGLAHLAATQETPTVLFYPTCLGQHWIVPVGNPNLRCIQIDPARAQAAPLLWAVNQAVEQLLSKNEWQQDIG